MRIFSFSFIIFFSFISLLQAQNPQENRADELLNRYSELNRFNGTALVVKDQKVVFNKGYGLADYEHNIPINNNTVFCITSITEQFTAYIALKVFEKKGLSFSTPIITFLENFNSSHADSLTLQHLLSHTSGFPDYPLIYKLPKDQLFAKEDIMGYIENLTWNKNNISEYHQSKLNYNLVGLILERVTNKSYGELLTEYICSPLGMKNTTVDDLTPMVKNRAMGYSVNFADGWFNAPYLDPSNTFASQGILSTTEDLLLWNNFIRTNYSQDEVLQEMLTTNESGYGYGLKIKRDEKGKIQEIRSVGGYTSGFNSFSILNINSGLTVIVLGNNRNPSSEDIADGLHSIFTNKDYTLPLARKIVKVDFLLLQKLAGDYKMNEHVTIKVMVEADKVFVIDGMHPKFEIFPQSENQFFLKGMDGEMVFIKNEKGIVTKIGLRDDGFINAFAEKIQK
jgi:CubicO group peptidase (beta-lactamase class C family)